MTVSLSADGLDKRFGGVVALSEASLEVNGGEVLALVGANGSGKSTLGKIVTGAVAPDRGRLLYNDQSYSPSSPLQARNDGIAAVYQDLSLVSRMTVAQNIWLGHEPIGWLGRRDQRTIARKTDELLNLFSGTLSEQARADTLVSDLAPGERQIVEILKVLSLEPQLIILDEATASLDSSQVDRLFSLVEDWKAQGMAVVFITHRMDEIFRLADAVTVLRDGETVGTVSIDETDRGELVEMMVGTSTVEQRQAADRELTDEVAVSVNNFRTTTLRETNFEVCRGEILGLGGLQGQGQSELLHAFFGDIPYSGEVIINGTTQQFRHPIGALKAGVAFVPGDRNVEGLMTIRPIIENLQLPSWRDYGIFIRMDEAREDAQNVSDRLDLVMSSLDAPINTLSGGNAQKVVIGKWLLRESTVLLLDDPTKGVDVGTKADFYDLLAELSDEGISILFHSSDDDELIDLCDRVFVFYEGQITAELQGDQLTRSELVAASMGTSEAPSNGSRQATHE